MVAPPPIELATIGWADSLILMVLALVVFGPRRLPQIARQAGKLMYEFRKASNDFKFQMEEELRAAEEADRRKAEEERLRALALAAPAQPAPGSQVSEAGTGASASVGPTPTGGSVLSLPATAESASSEEAAYPPVTAPAGEPPVGETHPRIQPPSTGELVPAAQPWSLEEELAKVSDAADDNGTVPAAQPETIAATEDQAPAAAEAGPADETASAMEQARHG
jgi:sec-independent protein translocase protein TatB